MAHHADIIWLAVAVLFYAAALYVAVFRIVKQHRTPSRTVNSILMIGLAFHLTAIILCGNPLAILAHVLSELAFIILIIYVIMQRLGRWGTLSIFIIPTALVLSLLSMLLPHQYTGVGVSNVLFAIHVVVSIAGIGGIFTGLFYTLLYVMQESALKKRNLGTWFHLIPSLSASEHFAWRSLVGGWYLYTIGMVLGSVWSYVSKHVWVSMSSKNLGGIAAWLVFTLLVVLHQTLHLKGKRSMVLYLLGFLFIVLAFTGIRLG